MEARVLSLSWSFLVSAVERADIVMVLGGTWGDVDVLFGGARLGRMIGVVRKVYNR